MPFKPKVVQYMCSYCGKITTTNNGRPLPGECPRKTRLPNGKMRPHTWVVKQKLS